MVRSAKLHARAKRISLPLDGDLVVGVAIYADDIETRRMLAEVFIHREKHRGGRKEFALLATVNGQHGPDEAACGPMPNFYEYEDTPIEHDEVDLTTATTKISAHRA